MWYLDFGTQKCFFRGNYACVELISVKKGNPSNIILYGEVLRCRDAQIKKKIKKFCLASIRRYIGFISGLENVVSTLEPLAIYVYCLDNGA